MKKNKRTITSSHRLTKIYSAIMLIGLIPYTAWADEEFIEFDPHFLQSIAGNTIDVSRFSYSNPVGAGNYIADINLNGEHRGRINLKFIESRDHHLAQLCASPELMTALDLTSDAIHSAKPVQDCLLFSQVVPEAKVNFDVSTLNLSVEIPQAFVVQRPRGYISPSRWQTGVPVAFIRYYANHYDTKTNNKHYNQTYLSLDTGFNIGSWAFRHRGSQSWVNGKRQHYQSNSTYIQRDIATVRGQLTIGDFTTNSTVMDAISIRGAQLASDDRMLATSERGYAPTIRGIANSNALVTVRQNGNVLKEVSVPAGPFVIDDLYPTGYAGDLEVEIRESNGEVRRFTVPYTATAQLIRPGYSRYVIAAGRYRYANRLYKEKVLQGTWQYGVTNGLTVNLGTILSNNYHSELFGISFNTPIGAFVTNATFSSAKFSPEHLNSAGKSDRIKGYNLYASYNTRINPTNTNLTVAAYRYLSNGYYSLTDFIEHNRDYFYEPRKINHRLFSYRPKNQFQVTIDQKLKDNWGHLYLTGSTSTYWSSNKRQFDYQVGYSNKYKNINYNISFYQTRNSTGERDRQIYLSLSMPLGSDNSTYVSQSLTHSRLNGVTTNTNLSGSLGKESQYTYSMSFNHQSQSRHNSFSFNNSYASPYARLDGGFTKSNDGSQQISLGVSGAIVAHPKGVTFTNSLGNTFAIIHAKGAKGAKITGSIGNEIDRFGNGIMPYLTPYAINNVGLDINSVPDTVELSATNQEVIPRANTALLVNFETTTGSVVFFEIKNTDRIPPIGTEVFDSKGQHIGIVAQGGRIYTRGAPASGKLQLSWGEQSCRINYRIPNDKQNSTTPVIIPVTCD
ncbi:fimbria/pilus outer membrane usher protein [Basilea psittacipulmonis]|uniref:Fimbrial protein n=1 Tax=Basilea psittacipulmonis DSM 24701 TaxID=1072685 RepID=A0A077DFP0_9BURK|nr:fimbria/pilus outer membrane usher protein [Basilea psittacipulmonis]AIL31988.1 fimbrial protein [Basilea psittacipulmonis DSM 24701]